MTIKDLRITKNRLACSTQYNGVERQDTLWRIGEFTTNGYWMIKKEFEGKILQSVPNGENAPSEEMVKQIMPSLDDVVRLEFVDIIEDENVLEFNNKPLPIIKLIREDNIYTYINAYFYKYFVNDGVELVQARGYEYKHFSSTKHLNPIGLVKNNQLIGVIMPIRK